MKVMEEINLDEIECGMVESPSNKGYSTQAVIIPCRRINREKLMREIKELIIKDIKKLTNKGKYVKMKYECARCGRKKTEVSMQIIDSEWVCKSGRCNT